MMPWWRSAARSGRSRISWPMATRSSSWAARCCWHCRGGADAADGGRRRRGALNAHASSRLAIALRQQPPGDRHHLGEILRHRDRALGHRWRAIAPGGEDARHSGARARRPRRWRGRPPSPRARRRRRPPPASPADGAGSGLRTGKLSPPPIAAKQRRQPQRRQQRRAPHASGLLVQTASRQPSSARAPQAIGDARDTAGSSTAACAP